MHLTLSQVAKHVGINKATLSRYIKQGKISHSTELRGRPMSLRGGEQLAP